MGPSTLPRHFPTFAAWYCRLLLLLKAMCQVVETLILGLPRMLFSARWLMIPVAVVGISLGLIMERRSRSLARAEHHRSQIVSQGWACGKTSWFTWYVDGEGRPATLRQIEKSEWHRKLYAKYRLAANYPWLPIEPDPPGTEAGVGVDRLPLPPRTGPDRDAMNEPDELDPRGIMPDDPPVVIVRLPFGS